MIAGKAKGLHLKTPKADGRVRPLTDRAREALFNILAEKVGGSSFLDLFAGTGAVGIEALSRGAKIAIFVELNRQVVALIRQNLAITGFTDRAEVYAVDALKAVNILNGKGARFGIIFIGAPYDSPLLAKVLDKIAEGGLLAPDGVLIAEHRKQQEMAIEYGKLQMYRTARYGETVFDFYKEKT
ncbi:MAG TPA: 16S rRNA (guanine(966)-N(2))-methyltransferase RsmD [Candidatus Sulfotelmatobacter sp.]|nr:16S rRNA (guanine(966)-N(2))-methyltransferase RsmD [Candidatus Sulfotelmatobacter sp.]